MLSSRMVFAPVLGILVSLAVVTSAPCIQESAFGPTVMCFNSDRGCRYHTATVDRGPSAGYANLVIDFSSGFTRITTSANDAVRAVRGGAD